MVPRTSLLRGSTVLTNGLGWVLNSWPRNPGTYNNNKTKTDQLLWSGCNSIPCRYSRLFWIDKWLSSYYYPSHWIQYQFCTRSSLSPLPGEHVASCHFTDAHKAAHAISTTGTFIFYQIPIMYTSVESSNVDKVSCWNLVQRICTV